MTDVVRVKDYPRVSGEVDDTQRVKRAVAAYLAGLRSRTAGVLDFGSGDYLVSSEIRIAQPGDAAVFGKILGDGPEVCVIRTYPGQRGITVVNPNVMEIGGFKMSGGPAKTTSLDHAGLVLGNSGSGVGHGCNIHDLRFEHYGIGLSLGDYLTAGAAAEMLCTNIGANQCHFGVAGFGFNTLNNTFTNLELNECDWGVYSDTAYGWAFYGGSLGNNIHSFHLVCGGEVLIEGMRDEFGPRTALSGGFITYGASTSIRLHVRGCQVLDQVAGRTILESIEPIAGSTSLILESSIISGTASASKGLSLRNTGFITLESKPYRSTPTAVEVFGCVRIDRADGQITADFPPAGGSAPPPPPVKAVYNVRFDSFSAAPTTRASAGQMSLTFTNTGNVSFTTADKITYWWVNAAGTPGNYGDRTALMALSPGGQYQHFPLNVLTPSTAGAYTLRVTLVHEPSTYFGTLDMPVTVV